MNIVITGATSGIGRAITEIFATEGNRLALCARSVADLVELEHYISRDTTCDHVIVQKVNVRHRNELAEFAQVVHEEYKKVDVLVNNAGVFFPGSIKDEDEKIFDTVMETNLNSAYFLTKAFLPNMIDQKKGHIINMCSVASIKGYNNGGSYAISKHALHGFGKTLREEVRDFGIRVTNVLPGATWTKSWEGVDLPESRLMQPHSIAQVVKTAVDLDHSAVMEDVILRPSLGDL